MDQVNIWIGIGSKLQIRESVDQQLGKMASGGAKLFCVVKGKTDCSGKFRAAASTKVGQILFRSAVHASYSSAGLRLDWDLAVGQAFFWPCPSPLRQSPRRVNENKFEKLRPPGLHAISEFHGVL
jgi:hypothetical protein